MRTQLPLIGSAMTDMVMIDIDMGLDEDIITTYWLSYDRYGYEMGLDEDMITTYWLSYDRLGYD
jgi:hypothetical protein